MEIAFLQFYLVLMCLLLMGLEINFSVNRGNLKKEKKYEEATLRPQAVR